MVPAAERASVRARLRRALKLAARRAAGAGAPVLVSVTERIPRLDPAAIFTRGRTPDRALLEQPDRDFSLAGVGAAAVLTGRGASRFQAVAGAWRDATAQAVVDPDPTCPVSPPVGLGGFAFGANSGSAPQWAPFGGARLVIPRHLVVSQGGSSWLTVSALISPGDHLGAAADDLDGELSALFAGCEGRDPSGEGTWSEPPAPAADRDAWEGSVRAAVEQIRAGAVDKVVLAREVRSRFSAAPDPGAALRRLRTRYGACTVFAFTAGGACFLGATPERLVRVDGRTVRAMALAGSAPRGATEAEDRAIGARLLADPKERHEHGLVVRALEDALGAVCSLAPRAREPELLRLPNVQHLSIPLEGTLNGRADLLDVVERVHPTPAVGGAPRDAALGLIDRYEGFDRGWYAAPVGWVDRSGSGEFVVAIRSALVHGRDVWLYAGCGVVSNSDPGREFDESELKLRPMRWALYGREG